MTVIPADHPTPRPSTARPSLKVTQVRVFRSEWTKLRSLRSTFWAMTTAMILLIGLGALVSAIIVAQYSQFDASELADFDAITDATLAGMSFVQLAFGVLGVLLFSGEYGTGMIRSSMSAVPRRLPVLWAKLLVFAGVSAVVSLVSLVVTFFVSQAILSTKSLDVSITSPDAWHPLLGAIVYLTLAGMIGVAIGALLRSTAAGISTFVGGFFLLPLLADLLPSSVRDHITPYLPSNAGADLYGGSLDNVNALSPLAGLAVLGVYTVTLIVAAAFRLSRTDV